MTPAVSAGAEVPKVLLPYQQRFVHAMMTVPVDVEEKSRRTGFSWAAGAGAVLTSSASKAANGMNSFYMGYNLEMAREFIGYCAMWAKQFAPAASEVQEFLFPDPDKPDADIRAFRISFGSGYSVIALPSMPRALRGMQGLVIIDEAAFHENLAELLKAAFALLIWGGRVVIISTHNGEDNPFAQLVADIRAGRKPYRLGRTSFQEALAEGLYRRICLTTGQEWSAEAEAKWAAEIYAFYGSNADEELDVIPNPTSGAWLPGTLLEARTLPDVPVLRLECPPGFAQRPEAERVTFIDAWCREHLAPVLARLDPERSHAHGRDFGRVGDLSVDWLLEIGRDLVRRTALVLESRNVPFEAQRQVLFFMLDRVPRFRASKLDAGGNGAYLAEVTQQKYGELRVEAVLFTEGWYRDNMPPLKAALEDATMLLPRDDAVLDDFRMVQLVRGIARVPDKRRNDGQAKRHGDAAIAGVLAFAASRAEPEEYDYRGAPPAHLNGDRDADDAGYGRSSSRMIRGHL